jgi:CheY-like chemotaxis protein/two-component sensor histidine kinase
VEAPNVLVVEDDPALGKLVGGLLDEAGYRAVTIADHALIAAAVNRWQPRCVILDGEVRLTGQGRSWDDAAAIRRAHPTMPVVMFTADAAALAEARAATSQRSRAAHFAGIVSKPFVVEEFLAMVRSVVEPLPPPEPTTPSANDRGPDSEDFSVFPDIGQHLVADWPETDLFGTVVHELRAPLTVIKSQVQLAQRNSDDPARARKAIDAALTQVDRMTRLIAELADHSRIESNGLSLKVMALDLASVVAEAIGMHENNENPHIRFQRPEAAVRVRGDADRIAQILSNLLDNALKYSSSEAPIEVALTTDGPEAQVRVADHGVGVPADERARLFAPFYRASSTRDVPGNGLGLHISRRLAERHGGRLWLEASSNAGSVFAFALPLAR